MVYHGYLQNLFPIVANQHLRHISNGKNFVRFGRTCQHIVGLGCLPIKLTTLDLDRAGLVPSGHNADGGYIFVVDLQHDSFAGFPILV